MSEKCRGMFNVLVLRLSRKMYECWVITVFNIISCFFETQTSRWWFGMTASKMLTREIIFVSFSCGEILADFMIIIEVNFSWNANNSSLFNQNVKKYDKPNHILLWFYWFFLILIFLYQFIAHISFISFPRDKNEKYAWKYF